MTTKKLPDVSAVNESERLEYLREDKIIEVPQCSCLSRTQIVPESGPCYTQLGCAQSLQDLRKKFEERLQLKGDSIRIETLEYTGIEGKTKLGCPIAKWIIRRSGPHEKVLVLAKNRVGHHCSSAWIVVASIAWEGVQLDTANDLYNTLVAKLSNFSKSTERGCGSNKDKTCACQGMGDNSGASFSFGCSWSMYFKGCKFARSKEVCKFSLDDKTKRDAKRKKDAKRKRDAKRKIDAKRKRDAKRKKDAKRKRDDPVVEENLNSLATNLAPVYKSMAPESYENQVAFEEEGKECRLGRKPGRPWSGVTSCVDFCAHAHKDRNNMNNGCTVVVTLTKHRGFEKPKDEQFHVLPLYIMAAEGQEKNIENGSFEVLNEYPMDLRLRTTPGRPKKKLKRKQQQMLNGNMKEQVKPNEESYYKMFSKNEENFLDGTIGGVAIALSHGSVLFECAKEELHATTPLKHPNKSDPTRLSLVFYQHKQLHTPNHGKQDYEKRQELKKGGSDTTKNKEVEIKPIPVNETVTSTTTTFVTVSPPFAPLKVTGPYHTWLV